MAEESAAPSTSADKTESMDVDGEAKKLLGLGQKNLVMGDIPAAVNAFQEAASLLGGKYGETADECAEAFFFYGKSLLELARMENGVLGNALEGVQVEEEEEKTEDATVESTDNIDEEEREELREQVYNAMGEKDESGRTGEEPVVKTEAEMQPKTKNVEMEDTKEEALNEPAVDVDHNILEEKKEEQEKTEKQVEAVVQEKEEGSGVSPEDPLEDDKARDEKPVAEEKASKEKERPEMSEKALEDTTVKKGTTALEMTSGEAKSLVKEMPEAAGKDTVEKQVTAEGEDKAVIEKAEEKLVTLVPEKQAGIIENNAVVEEITKASDEAVEGKEVAIAVEKVECEVEKAEEHPASDENVKTMDPAEQVMDSEEKEESKEPLTSKDVLPSAPSEEITPAGAIDKCDEAQTEEKAEEAAKLEKEDEKDDEMREGEETEGSEEDKTEEDEDKAEEEKENDSTVEEKESEDEVGNLELAWDMLELAKVIYKRQDTKEAQLFAAQAHLKLGEVSIESENYVQAIEEFHSCLNLQQKYLEAHDRLLAETHYHLGLAYHYNNQYEEAVQQFSRSMDVINKRLEMLTECLKSKGEGSTEDEKEIEELKGLLPEIKEKIEDSKESQKSARVAEIALQATLVGGSSSSFSQGTESGLASTIPVGQKPDGASQCITDISHLVRKKRKPEEEPQQGDNEAKKSKPESTVNGGDAPPSGNDEVAEKMEEETEGRPQVETVQSAV
nr:nuclear autoantigenic sperm protein isoform X1 [Anolis sagrei ordinatus]XP_060629360.1 nuclear autoantigenic sperm protein isoform X1 [Anolis sagrei ordinatus]XP_060629362.1 nuclear autoantigenic sperm protein isoform X1 [Anolis sagrei ordinatus]